LNQADAPLGDPIAFFTALQIIIGLKNLLKRPTILSRASIPKQLAVLQTITFMS